MNRIVTSWNQNQSCFCADQKFSCLLKVFFFTETYNQHVWISLSPKSQQRTETRSAQLRHFHTFRIFSFYWTKTNMFIAFFCFLLVFFFETLFVFTDLQMSWKTWVWDRTCTDETQRSGSGPSAVQPHSSHPALIFIGWGRAGRLQLQDRFWSWDSNDVSDPGDRRQEGIKSSRSEQSWKINNNKNNQIMSSDLITDCSSKSEFRETKKNRFIV